MSDPAQAPATPQDLLQVPPERVAEILGGRLVSHPRPVPRHALAASSLGDELVGPFQGVPDRCIPDLVRVTGSGCSANIIYT
ncbi:MAG: hypothetical protein U5S82_11270 [Gammaproteobacteria bacterium]|nr:hypothetical protein [Gammaproteobacteria bacterium]